MRGTYLVRRSDDRDPDPKEDYQTMSLPDVPEDVGEGFEIEIEIGGPSWEGDWRVVRKWGRVTRKGWFQFLMIERIENADV